MKPEYQLGWGEPLIVRQALVETLGHDIPINPMPFMGMGYPPHTGNIKLVEHLKDIAERQSGSRPKHLVVTNGATGAINAAIYALRDPHAHWIVTNKRYYPIYPAIIEAADLLMIDEDKKNKMIKEDGLSDLHFISLLDSPSNPDGTVYPFKTVDIWDSSYASKTYKGGSSKPYMWKIMAGSASKTLGLAGLRLGWASTDDDSLALKLTKYVTASYAGISSLSQAVAEEVLSTLGPHGLDLFEKRSAGYIDNNREEMQRLLTKFGQGDVPTRGMFATVQLGKLERKALTKANIKWVPGTSWGEDDNWARLSLGQTREITQAAVKAALK